MDVKILFSFENAPLLKLSDEILVVAEALPLGGAPATAIVRPSVDYLFRWLWAKCLIICSTIVRLFYWLEA